MAAEYFLMNTNTAVLASPLAQPLGTLTEQPALAAVSLGLREMDQHKKKRLQRMLFWEGSF